MNIDRVKRHSDERVKNGLPAIEIDKKDIKEFAKKKFEALAWNGRQIKNAFQSALTLAEMDAQQTEVESPRLTAKQFKLIARASEQFEHYMIGTHHGKTEDEIAHREHVRFTPKKSYEELWSDDDSSESEHGSVHKASKKSKSKSKSKKSSMKRDSSSSEEGEGETVRKSNKKSKKVQQSDSSDEDEDGPTRKSSKKRSKQGELSDSSEEES